MFPNNLLEILGALGFLIRPLGVLVFGLAAGWLTMHILKTENESWQIRLAVFLGLLAAFVLIGHWVSGGATLGMFGLGAGGGVLFWGLMANRKEEGEER